MAEANLSLQVLPIVADDQVYSMVDKVINIIIESGLKYVVGPMETTVEGDLDTLLELVKKSHEVLKEAGVPRVVSVVKIDYKPDGVTMEEKIGKYRR